MTDQALFGLELQRARDRRGLSLDQLADATKVSSSLFAGLERGDVSRWPGGIFRRSFVRSYARAVGLDAEETLARFLRLFPDADQRADAVPPPDDTTAGAEPALRLVTGGPAKARPAAAQGVIRRVGAAAVDLGLAGLPAAGVSIGFGWQWFFPVAALIGLFGHLLAVAVLGGTPGTRLLLARPAPPAPVSVEGGTEVHRVEPESVAPASRRRLPRHSAPHPVAAGRTRRVQH